MGDLIKLSEFDEKHIIKNIDDILKRNSIARSNKDVFAKITEEVKQESLNIKQDRMPELKFVAIYDHSN